MNALHNAGLSGGAVPPGNEGLSLSFTAEPGMVEGILSLVEEWAARLGVYKDDRTSLRLVLEELLINLCLHAGRQAKGGEVKAELAVKPLYAPAGILPENTPRRVQRLVVSLQDTGPEFNPLEHEGAKAETVREAVPGGHGLTLVRLLTAELEYARRYGNNLLKLTLACNGPGAASTPGPGDAARPAPEDAASGESFFRTFPRIWYGSLAVRQAALFFCISLVMLWGGLFFYYLAARDFRAESSRKLCMQALHTQSVTTAAFLERLSRNFADLTEDLAGLSEHAAIPDDETFFEALQDGVLIRTVTAEKAVLGVLRGERGKPGALLLYRTGETVSRLFLPQSFDPFVEKSAAAPGGRPVWVGPVRDLPGEEGGAGLLLGTFGKDENGKEMWIGLIVTMPWIAATLGELSGFEHAVAAFVTERGEYVIYPPGRNHRGGPQSLGGEAGADAAAMRELRRALENNGSGIIPLEALFPDATASWAVPWPGASTLAYAPTAIPGWDFILLVSSEEIGATPPSLPPLMLLLAALGPFLVAAAAWKACSGVARPMGRLSDALQKITDGDLDTPLPVAAPPDETSGMLHAFEHVRVTLKHSFANLMEATAAEQRVRNELTLARSIQESMLPASPPKVPGIRVATSLDMAGEVCGDLFDCFTLPDTPDTVHCLIGDVCGKGIPASVIMSRTMVLARSFLLSGETLPGILSRLNEALLRSNDSLMFVTLMVAKLEGSTGRFTWASAGHPPPMLGPAIAGETQDAAGILPWSRELVLGVKPDVAYTEHAVQLARGQSVLLHTDGADEAMAQKDRPLPSQPGQTEGMRIFGTDRLQAVFNNACGSGKKGPRAALEEIRAALAAHMGGRPPSDDISLIVMRWEGG